MESGTVRAPSMGSSRRGDALCGWSLCIASGSPTPEAGARTWQVRIASKVGSSSWLRAAQSCAMSLQMQENSPSLRG
jgi:hypothetical protein